MIVTSSAVLYTLPLYGSIQRPVETRHPNGTVNLHKLEGAGLATVEDKALCLTSRARMALEG